MSYASVAAHNAPPPSKQPHPDPALLDTDLPTAGVVSDNSQKINVVAPGFKEHPKTVTGETDIITEIRTYDDEGRPVKDREAAAKKKARDYKTKAKHELDRAEEEGEHLWSIAKEQLLRPGVAGGLVGLINVGLIGAASYQLYTKPEFRRDTRVLSTLAISGAALLGIEGFAAERYARTPRGQEEAKRAKADGAAIYRHSKEIVLRPGVLGGIVGIVNVGVLGTVGWYAYTNWDAPRWDRRVVSAVTAGLVALWGGEGVLAEMYRETH